MFFQGCMVYFVYRTGLKIANLPRYVRIFLRKKKEVSKDMYYLPPKISLAQLSSRLLVQPTTAGMCMKASSLRLRSRLNGRSCE